MTNNTGINTIYKILKSIDNKGQDKITIISKKTDLNLYYIYKMVKIMEAHGLVKTYKHGRDKRIKLTNLGSDLLLALRYLDLQGNVKHVEADEKA